MSAAQEERLRAAATWQERYEANDLSVIRTDRPCSTQSRAPETLRRVARPVAIRGTGWYLLCDKLTGIRIGAAHWAEGTLTIYGPPWPGRRRAPNGEAEDLEHVARPRRVWVALLALLGESLAADEAPGVALARVEKTEQFQRLVK